MTKRIVSGIFILTALGALGVILAGALTSGEQLIVRFLTAVIVAALGLYVISDLRLQADDDNNSGRAGGQNRVGKVNAPPNSTAAFMATVTRKQDTGEHATVRPATGELPAMAGNDRNSQDVVQVADKPPSTVNAVAGPDQPAAAVANIEHDQTTVTDPTPAETAGSPQKTDAGRNRVRAEKRSVASKRVDKVTTARANSGIDTVVAPGPEFRPSSDHALAGVGAVVASASATGDVPGQDGEVHHQPSTSGGGEPPATGDFGPGGLDISDLFADRTSHPPANGTNRFDNGRSFAGEPNGDNNPGWDGQEHSPAGHKNDHAVANGDCHDNRSAKSGRNGSADHGNSAPSTGNGSNGNFWSSSHISGRLSESAAGIDPSDVAPATPFFDPTERVYDVTGLEPSGADKPDEVGQSNGSPADQEPDLQPGVGVAFEYSDSLQAESYVWPAQPMNELPDPHPFEKASAAYEAAKRQLEVAAEAGDKDDTAAVVPISPEDTEQDSLAPIIDLREMVEPDQEDVEAAINAGEVEVIATLIEQGMLSTAGPISDREVRTMVYVAFTSNELRKLLMAGGTPDGPNYGLDLGPVELFDEQTHAPAPKRLYAGNPMTEPTRQLG